MEQSIVYLVMTEILKLIHARKQHLQLCELNQIIPQIYNYNPLQQNKFNICTFYYNHFQEFFKFTKDRQQMNFQQIKKYDGQCCPQSHIQGSINEKLHCIICYQVMTKPVALQCQSKHTFGMACIKQWINSKKSIECPYCKQKVDKWTKSAQIQEQIQKLTGICHYCDHWKGPLNGLQMHRTQCQSYLFFLQNELRDYVEKQLKQLDKEINPHLKQKHLQIYNNYVKDWQWLGHDAQDWKWWWWCNNPWWDNVACPQCNVLWHKYQKTIDLIEAQRVHLIAVINRIRDKNKQVSAQKAKMVSD